MRAGASSRPSLLCVRCSPAERVDASATVLCAELGGTDPVWMCLVALAEGEMALGGGGLAPVMTQALAWKHHMFLLLTTPWPEESHGPIQPPPGANKQYIPSRLPPTGRIQKLHPIMASSGFKSRTDALEFPTHGNFSKGSKEALSLHPGT